MLQAKKYGFNGNEIGTVELSEKIFAVETKNPNALLYEVINMYLGNQRLGTSKVKTRGEVHGSSKKLFRQKGTGNARPGNLRTPVRVGGGNAFGPKPKNWYKRIPKKKKRLALKIALSDKAANSEIIIVESLDFDKPSTKRAKEFLSKVSSNKRKKLILTEGTDHKIIRSFGNLSDVKMNRADSIFAYEIINSNLLIITEKALKVIEEVFA